VSSYSAGPKLGQTYTQTLHQGSIAQAAGWVAERISGVVESRGTARLITVMRDGRLTTQFARELGLICLLDPNDLEAILGDTVHKVLSVHDKRMHRDGSGCQTAKRSKEGAV
jgi:hypothetical protein